MILLRRILSLTALAAALLVGSNTDLHAQTGVKSKWDEVSLGNEYVGVDVIGWARTRNDLYGQSRVDEMARIDLVLLKRPIELHRMAATAVHNGTSFWGSAGVRRGGIALQTDYYGNGGGHADYTKNGTVFGSNPYLTVNVYGLDITIGANIGHTVVMDTTLLNWVHSSASMLSGEMDSYAWGWASLSVGYAGVVSVGLQVDIQIGRQQFDGVLSASPTYLGHLYLDYKRTAVRLLLKLLLQFGFFSPTVTLVDASLGSRCFEPLIP